LSTPTAASSRSSRRLDLVAYYSSRLGYIIGFAPASRLRIAMDKTMKRKTALCQRAEENTRTSKIIIFFSR